MRPIILETESKMLRNLRQRLSLTDVFLWLIGGSVTLLIVVGSIATLRAGHYTTRQWMDLVVFGVAQGSIYALIALGYTLVYGILRMINFAHSEIFMSGAFTGYFVADAMGRSGFLDQQPVIGILILFAVAMSTSIVIAVLFERIAYRPLRR